MIERHAVRLPERPGDRRVRTRKGRAQALSRRPLMAFKSHPVAEQIFQVAPLQRKTIGLSGTVHIGTIILAGLWK